MLSLNSLLFAGECSVFQQFDVGTNSCLGNVQCIQYIELFKRESHSVLTE